MTIEVLHVRPLTNPTGNLRAFASVKIAGKLVINSCRIIQQPGQRAYVAMPQNEYQKDGKARYSAIVEVPEEWKRQIEDQVLAQWNEQQGENQDAGGGW